MYYPRIYLEGLRKTMRTLSIQKFSDLVDNEINNNNNNNNNKHSLRSNTKGYGVKTD
jgi:hypothetical protein